MAREERWVLADLYTRRYGTPPWRLNDLDGLTAAAAMTFLRDEVDREDLRHRRALAQRRREGEAVATGRGAVRLPDGTFVTGDPVVDAWEAALARGEDPDLRSR